MSEAVRELVRSRKHPVLMLDTVTSIIHSFGSKYIGEPYSDGDVPRVDALRPQGAEQ